VTTDFKRTDRISSSMQKALAQIIREEVKDPRVGMVTVHAVRTLKDLSHAKVFFTLLQVGDIDKKQAERILQNASGFIRRQLGRAIKLRNVPELKFIYDSSIEDGSKLHALIEKTVRDDEESSSADTED